jgi:hypothetical protein
MAVRSQRRRVGQQRSADSASINISDSVGRSLRLVPSETSARRARRTETVRTDPKPTRARSDGTRLRYIFVNGTLLSYYKRVILFLYTFSYNVVFVALRRNTRRRVVACPQPTAARRPTRSAAISWSGTRLRRGRTAGRRSRSVWR